LRALKLGLLALTSLVSLPAAAGYIYCCDDARGKQSCGDIVPQACIGRAYRVIGSNGVVVREVAAPLTAEQRAQKEAEEKRQKEAEEAAKEQRRLDQALLQTYGSEADIEMMRKTAKADTLAAIKSAEDRIAAAKKRRTKFEAEAEFYRNKTMPPEVAKGLKEADIEIDAQKAVIETKRAEQKTIDAKYDEDARRFRALKGKPAAN